MGVVFTNNAETTLAAAISSTSATSISVTSSSTFPAIQAGEYFYATVDDGTNHEIVKITGISGTTWTVVRATDNSTARTFANGSTVQLRATAALLTDIQENIAAKSANQTVYNATAASNATAYDVGVNPGVEANAMVFLDGVMQHHDTFSFSGSTLTFDAAPTNGTKIEVIVDNLINLQSSNLTTDTFTATSGQTAFTLSDAPAAENNLIVFIDGVFQDQGNYSISNHTLTLATGAVEGRTVTVYIINPVNIGTPSDGTVTGAKLSGNITMPGTLTVGAFDVAFDSPTFFVDNSNSRVGLGTATPSVPVDIVGEVKTSSHINIGGNLVKASGDLTLDAAGGINLDSDGGEISFKDAGTEIGKFNNSSSDFAMEAGVQDKDILFKGNDGGTGITALSLDMSEGGVATFNAGLVIPSSISHAGDSDTKLDFNQANTMRLITGDVTAWICNASSMVVNEDSVDFDFRVESNGNTHMLFVDGGNNRVGIGTGDPAYKLDIVESVGNYAAQITNNHDSSEGLLIRCSDNDNNRYLINCQSSTSATGTNYASQFLITKAGNVSIGGTLSPSATLHVVSAAGSNKSVIITRSSGAEAVNLAEMLSHNALQILNKASGSYLNFAGNAANSQIQAQSDGSTAEDIALNPYGGLVLINATTNAGLSNNNPSAKYGFSFGGGQQVSSTNDDTNLILNMTGGSSNAHVQFRSGGGNTGNISTNGSAVAFNAGSDYRLKENVIPLKDGLDRLNKLNPVQFDWKKSQETDEGFIAHEVQEIVPYVVKGEKDGEEIQTMDYGKLTPLLVKAIQEQQAQIEILKTEIQELKDNG